jgi:hypothetical protein
MQAICKNCGTEFEIKKHCKTFCSIECRNKSRWNDDEYRQRHTEKNKITANKEEQKERLSKLSKERWNDDEFKAATKNKMQVHASSPDERKRRSELQSFRLRSDITLYNNLVANNRQRASSDAYRTMKSNQMLLYWSNKDFAERVFNSSHRYKSFELPSGRIVKIQGYEPQVLSELLKTYSEDDIVIGVKEMNAAIGKIQYMYEGNLRTYYPDFYIKSTNTIIEVKSTYTFEKWKDKNLAKKQACLQLGFNFEFVIL